MCSGCLPQCGSTAIPGLMLGFPTLVLREVTHVCLLASLLSLVVKVAWDDGTGPEIEQLRMLRRRLERWLSHLRLGSQP